MFVLKIIAGGIVPGPVVCVCRDLSRAGCRAGGRLALVGEPEASNAGRLCVVAAWAGSPAWSRPKQAWVSAAQAALALAARADSDVDEAAVVGGGTERCRLRAKTNSCAVEARHVEGGQVHSAVYDLRSRPYLREGLPHTVGSHHNGRAWLAASERDVALERSGVGAAGASLSDPYWSGEDRMLSNHRVASVVARSAALRRCGNTKCSSAASAERGRNTARLSCAIATYPRRHAVLLLSASTAGGSVGRVIAEH